MRKVAASAAIPFLLAAVCTFVASFFGLTFDQFWPEIVVLHVGLIVFAIVLSLIEKRERHGRIAILMQDSSEEKPAWIDSTGKILFLIFLGMFVTFLTLSRGSSPQIVNGEHVLNNHGVIVGYLAAQEYRRLRGWELRLFASGWIFGYFVLMTKLWFRRHEETPWAVDP